MDNISSRLSRPQLKKIWATARELQLNSELLHLLCLSQTGQAHISQLTRNKARIFIDDLNKLKGDVVNKYHASVKIDRMIRDEGMILGCTPAQCDKIRYLMEEAGWTEGRLKEYLEQFGAKQPADLTRTLASNLIEYLKSEIARSGRMVAHGT